MRGNEYRGLAMRCAPGTHEAALALLLTHTAPVSGVLDIAAGTGAFLARLIDAGFRDLHAIELDTANFGIDEIRPLAVDLNTDFAPLLQRKFHVITAIEIIEHLDSPRHFLRQIYSLLEPGGILLVSTPNVAHWVGRVKFVLTGELRFFGENLYHEMRHISPITDLHMRLALGEVGFDLLATTSAGEIGGPLYKLLAPPVHRLSRLVFGPRGSGDVNIYVARRPVTAQ